jgi:hypothetical protein
VNRAEAARLASSVLLSLSLCVHGIKPTTPAPTGLGLQKGEPIPPGIMFLVYNSMGFLSVHKTNGDGGVPGASGRGDWQGGTRIDNIRKLAEALEVDPAELVGDA